MKIFVIGDTHFSHTNIIKYCDRPFKSSVEMDETLIDNWNGVVSDDDLVIHVGDFALGGDPNKAVNIMRRLNGRIILTPGNHDRNDFLKAYRKAFGFDKISIKQYYSTLFQEGKTVLFSHYPTDVQFSFPEHPGYFPNPKGPLKGFLVSYHIHGHIHNKPSRFPQQYNVSVECINYTPILLTEVLNTLYAANGRSSQDNSR